MSQPADDDAPLDPAETLRLITAQRGVLHRRLSGDPLLYWGPWGAAWLIGFALFVLRWGLSGEPIVDMPTWIPLTVLFTLMAVAMAVTTWLGGRSARYTSGPSNTQGMMYGLSWLCAFAVVAAIAVRFGRGLPEDERGLLWASLSVAVTGILYVAGAAIWREWSMFAMGALLIVVDAVGVSIGPGWHALLTSLAGAALLIGGTAAHLRLRRAAS